MKKIILLALFIPTLTRAADTIVSNPARYAYRTTQEYADNMCDISPCRVRSCADLTENSDEPKFECRGVTTQLMHGGYPVKTEFTCEFQFRAHGKKFQLLHAECGDEEL